MTNIRNYYIAYRKIFTFYFGTKLDLSLFILITIFVTTLE